MILSSKVSENEGNDQQGSSDREYLSHSRIVLPTERITRVLQATCLLGCAAVWVVDNLGELLEDAEALEDAGFGQFTEGHLRFSRRERWSEGEETRMTLSEPCLHRNSALADEHP